MVCKSFGVWSAGFGSINFNALQWFPVNGYAVHPQYASNNALVNNIAMLRLTVPITLAGVTPIPFSTVPATPGVGVLGNIAGFGESDQTHLEPTISDVLRTGTKNTVAQGVCQDTFSFLSNAELLAAHFCAINIASATNICGGDQGTGFVTGNTLLGIASTVFDANNCAANTPALYTRAGSFAVWMNPIIDGNTFTPA